MIKPCPFCDLTSERIIARHQRAVAFFDAFPATPGHTLIVPTRHIASFFETTQEERLALFDLLDQSKQHLDAEFHPAGYNIGLNDGAAAGQTVPHLHIHLMPRFDGDSGHARGGVRWIFPEKANYWKDRE
jgi:diadenosine tetraphosphate (Ap4A) HIT family hydrolase